MAFTIPVAGLSIAAISIIPGLIASSQKSELKQLKGCKKFPLNSSIPTTDGYYWLRGPLQSKNPIKVDINTGSFVVSKDFGIMQYNVDRCIESKHITKHVVEEKQDSNSKSNANNRREGEQLQPGAAPKDNDKPKRLKEEKRTHWKQKYENVYKSPIEYASILQINGININEFKGLFSLEKQYELFTASPNLNDKGNSNVVNLNLNLNLGGSNGGSGDDIVGEQERRTIGYRHKWYGVNIGDDYTVIGYYDGQTFMRGNKLNMVDKKGYYEILKGYENSIWWLQMISMTGLLVSGGVAIYEMDLLSKS